RLESGLLASGDVTLTGGTPGADDDWNGSSMFDDSALAATDRNRLSVLINTAGGITGAGLGAGLNADGSRKGSTVTINGSGRVEIMGWINAGGKLSQTFDSQGHMLAQSMVWSGRDSDIKINSTARAYIGGSTLNQAGAVVSTGGYLNASRLIDVRGGVDPITGFGLKVDGAAELVVEGRWNADHTVNAIPGSISLYGVGDVDMQGLLLAGGRSEMVRDANGKYLGRNIVHYDVDSTISVQADRQLIIGTDITAGKQIDLIGGLDTRTESVGSPYFGRGLVLYGSASITTTRQNSQVNLNGPGRVDLLAPGDVNELSFSAWPVSADGKLARDVTLVVRYDRVSFTVEAAVTIHASDTSTNTTLSDLTTDISNALAAANWKVMQSDGPPATPVLGKEYAGFATMPGYVAGEVADVRAKLREGHIVLAGPYAMQVLASSSATGSTQTSVNAADLGVFSGSQTALESGRRYAVDAAAAGSTVTIGKPGGPNGKLYIAGKVRAYSAINLNSGTSADGRDIDLDATGVLETINGSIQFVAGENGVLQGDIIAGGAGSDVILSSGRSLTIQGLIQAADQVRLQGGDGTLITDNTKAGYLSLLLDNTATVRTTDANGAITISGTNLVYLNGAISTTLGSQAITLRSDLGDLVLDRTSGRIDAAGQLTIAAVNLDLQGPIVSSYVSADAPPEVRISATHDAALG
ncbi:MAG: hypothetical protein ACR2I0_07175, partial [Rhodoferax sp.]